jgi:ribosomal protein S27AE
MDKYIDNFSRQQKKAKIYQSKKLKSTGVPTIQRQMYLDLGQKLFGKNKECPKCGMFYVIGDTDDECRHSRLCAKVIRNVLCNLWHISRIN